jgi:multidrug resistance protein, MATE family
VPLAWPVFVGQLAVLAFGVIDTLLVARHSVLDLAALAIGGAAYISIFIGLMGVVLAISPLVGQLYGAKRLPDAGAQLVQAQWLALLLCLPGCALLLWPTPFLALAQAPPEVADKVCAYLGTLAWALPPALLFTAFRGFNTAVSRPKVVMALQLGALALKLPLSALLVFGVALPWGLPAVPALGAPGCALATTLVMWVQCVCAHQVLCRDPFYKPFSLPFLWPPTRPLHRSVRPHGPSLRALLRLGVPMGLSVLIEVTGFTFMAFFIARMGTTAVAGHQIAANPIAMLFMMPLALGNATATLVAQRLGAGDAPDAQQLGWHGVTLGLIVATVMGCALYLGRGVVLAAYTPDAVIAAAALPLLAWVVVFHIADAAQAITAFVLRAHRVTTVPLIIYTLAIWGVGLGGGYLLAFDSSGLVPSSLRGAQGYWVAATAGLVLAAAGLVAFLAWCVRVERQDHTPPDQA